MATVHPFRALRPRRDYVHEVVGTVPNNIISVEEAREIVARYPMTFLRVIKPEVDLERGAHGNVYEQGAANLRTLIESKYFTQEDSASLYVYQLEDDDAQLTGLFGCVSVGEYDDGTIVPHEKTRPAKESVRTRHLLALKVHPEPVMITYNSDAYVADLVSKVRAATDPFIDFTDQEGTRHVLWKVPQSTEIVNAFGRIPRLYVADGHHRCKAASRAAKIAVDEKGVSSEIQFFPAVLFPMEQMRIKAYNRVVYSLPITPTLFLEKLEALSYLERNISCTVPEKKGVVCIYLAGKWHRCALPPPARSEIAADLDVAKLSDHILKPLLGITDSRTDENLGFVSGREGVEQLAKMVDEGIADVAFSLYPTSIDELVQVTDAGELMPPKSTWFEPKLKSGLLVHDFREEANARVESSPKTFERT